MHASQSVPHSEWRARHCQELKQAQDWQAAEDFLLGLDSSSGVRSAAAVELTPPVGVCSCRFRWRLGAAFDGDSDCRFRVRQAGRPGYGFWRYGKGIRVVQRFRVG